MSIPCFILFLSTSHSLSIIVYPQFSHKCMYVQNGTVCSTVAVCSWLHSGQVIVSVWCISTQPHRTFPHIRLVLLYRIRIPLAIIAQLRTSVHFGTIAPDAQVRFWRVFRPAVGAYRFGVENLYKAVGAVGHFSLITKYNLLGSAPHSGLPVAIRIDSISFTIRGGFFG